MIVSGHSMDLYCRKSGYSTNDEPKVGHPVGYLPHHFVGNSFADCKRQARLVGWKFHRDGDVTCPLCQKRIGRLEISSLEISELAEGSLT
jgi:hypothetical protein